VAPPENVAAAAFFNDFNDFCIKKASLLRGALFAFSPLGRTHGVSMERLSPQGALSGGKILRLEKFNNFSALQKNAGIFLQFILFKREKI